MKSFQMANSTAERKVIELKSFFNFTKQEIVFQFPVILEVAQHSK